MEETKISEKRDLNSIKLIRGQRGGYGFEIKLVSEGVDDILKDLKTVNDELVKTYIDDLNEIGGK